ncbi:hypothetical protein BGW42_000130 [Actinomortierella wolfii]|nr:hypothetical protein BGW42_000130 [Actinomortierella wolfii]
MHRPTSRRDLITQFHKTWADEASVLTPVHCGHAVFETLRRARQHLLDLVSQDAHDNAAATCQTLLQTSDVLIDYAYEKLHAFPYRQVPACWRELYTDASVFYALALWQQCETLAVIDGSKGSGENKDEVSEACQQTDNDQLENDQPKGEQESVEKRRLAIRILDKALVLAGACGPGRRAVVMNAIETLEDEIEHCLERASPPSLKKRKMGHQRLHAPLGKDIDKEALPALTYPIPRCHQPSLEAFARHVHQPHPTPLIITGAMEHWPALTKWKDLDALCKAAGPDRLVPIEIGSQYTDEHWTQKLVTTREFIEQYIFDPSHISSSTVIDRGNGHEQDSETAAATKAEASKKAVGYLAQHDLFQQIPRLRRDIDIPDYCWVGPPEDQEGYEPPDDTLLNAWFGPRGTVSPLHTDPYHNLLAQVVGYKYVRLYAPSQTRFLYSYGSQDDPDSRTGEETEQSHDNDKHQKQDESSPPEASMLSNTSRVDVEHPDLERYPLFKQAEYVETVLGPGELLYIPFQWWHYIRSLSVSFSVSFWF